MRYLKIWVIVLLNVFGHLGYYTLAYFWLNLILPFDFSLHIPGYRFGQGSVALLVTLILYLVCVLLERRIMKKNMENSTVRKHCIAAMTLLSVSFVIQVFRFLEWYGWFSISYTFWQFKREIKAFELPDLNFISNIFYEKRPNK